ncbi:hypothetical protein CkaCkLH20_11032 [Colletotrichum karsti]|uniref:Uncharacterized protein n=1 Tax=Colletotrichum karsti TaxID=1095194 RepID=A0A9P6HWG5_9PEZI|nr:uncharacterized protein CkaCkLH20_11032 [Colletotrichum karsti]KAF9871385.1 hypothetical protein CkaCkLH20_11032 [Colletotrichum karsti]
MIISWMQGQPDTDGLRAKAREAAEIIVREKYYTVPPLLKKSWIVQASTIAAGVFLCLDLLFLSAGEGPEQLQHCRRSVETCIGALEVMGHGSLISKRGPMILRTLLGFESQINPRTIPDEQLLRNIVTQVSKLVSSASAFESELDMTMPTPRGVIQSERWQSQNLDITLNPCNHQAQVFAPLATEGDDSTNASPEALFDGSSQTPYGTGTAGVGLFGPGSVEGIARDPFGYIMARAAGNSCDDDTATHAIESFENPFEFTDEMYFKNQS